MEEDDKKIKNIVNGKKRLTVNGHPWGRLFERGMMLLFFLALLPHRIPETMFGSKRTAEPRSIRITIPCTLLVLPTKMTRLLFIAGTLHTLESFTPGAALILLPFALTIKRATPKIVRIVLMAYRDQRGLIAFFLISSGGSPALRALFLITLTFALFPGAMEFPIASRAITDGIAFLQAHIFFALVKAVSVLLIASTLLPVQLIALGPANVVGRVVIAQGIMIAPPEIVLVIFMANRDILFAAGLDHAIPLRFIVALMLLGRPCTLGITLAGQTIVAKRAALG